ncbi:hypothetical protein Gotur_024655 [Gossypium turneri]
MITKWYQMVDPATHGIEKMRFGKVTVAMVNADIAFGPSCKLFAVNNADYPKIEAEVKSVAEELGIDHPCNDILFGDATVDDEERIRSALDSEDAIPGSGDWAVHPLLARGDHEEKDEERSFNAQAPLDENFKREPKMLRKPK